jgi:hypothetical protein
MTELTNERHHVPCPYPGCNATLKISAMLPAGEYKCICWACLVRVAWATSVDFQRTPYVELVEKDGKP